MRTIRTSGAIAVLFALVAAGCGGSAASSAPADAGSGTGNGGASGAASVEPAAATTPEPAGNGGASGTNAEQVGDQLKPPNATETSKTTTDTYWYVLYHSTDSADSLKGFYEGQIPKTGLKIISTTSSNGGYVWLVATDDSGAFGGSVSVVPSPDGAGSDVIVGVGSST